VRRIRKNGMRALALAAAGVAVTAVVASAATKVTLKSGNIEVTIEGGVSPKALPRHDMAGVTLKLNGKMKTTDGSHISAVKTISLDFDKAGKLFTKGLASCKQGQLESTVTAQAKRVCGKALVGTGNVTADISLPEQQPFGASGPLLIFNSSTGNKQSLLLHVHANVPAPTTFVVPVKISKAHGKYGTNAFIKVPTIVSGSGSVTSFKATIGKKWTYKGKKVDLLNASCPTGALFVHGELAFVGGTKLDGTISAPCTPKG
jgi:hypothetical protein